MIACHQWRMPSFQVGWREDVGHEEVYAEIKKIRDQVKLLHRDFAPDTENVLKRVKRGRGRQIGFRYWWKYAALFILPLGVVLVLWQGMKMNRWRNIVNLVQFLVRGENGQY